VGDEPEPPYSRMAIPYLLIGDIGEAGTYLRKAADHFAGLRITQRQSVARTVDTQAKAVTLNDGGTLPYDRLLLATGSSPADPPIPGIHSPGVMTCWTLADARKIAASVRRGAARAAARRRFIGCIIIESIAARWSRSLRAKRP
jgi:NAD(P)H-nitrite reductase large subunit